MAGPSAVTLGTVLDGRYQVDALLGADGAAETYRAVTVASRTPVSILALQVAASQTEDLHSFLDRLRSSLGALPRPARPSLPRLLDSFTDDGWTFVVTEYVVGQTLDQLDRPQSVPERQALDWCLQVADTLDFLHSLSPPIVFGDVQPASIKVDPTGRVWLLGYGLGWRASGEPPSSAFAAPEPAYTEKGDIYALGATLFYLLARCPPPRTEDRAAPLIQCRPRITSGTMAAVGAMLGESPEDRPPSLRHVRSSLTNCRAEIVSEDTGVFARSGGDTDRFAHPDPPATVPRPEPEPLAPPVYPGLVYWPWVGAILVVVAAIAWWLHGAN